MSLIMDNRLESTATEAEVKKLQALVKELELQNEELRTERQQLMKEGGSSTPHSLPSAPATPKKQPSENLDAMAPLGLEEESLSDEETWLFDSPSTKSHTTDWLRKDIDDPSLQQSKRSLINKLDQIAMSPHQSPRHSFSPCSSSGVLSPESPPSSRGEIDTRTFVRSKKKRSLAFGEAVNDENRNSLLKRDGSSREYLARSSGSLGSEEDDRLSSASEGSFSYQLTDVADVNALARLQEESLKLPDPRRTSRLPGIRGGPNTTTMNHPYSSAGSGGSITSSQEDLIANPNPTGSPRRPPRGLQAPTRYSAHTNASREGSDLSTPPDSPYNSQHNLEYCNGRGGGGNMRHSGGGLHRGLGGSDPRLLDHHHLPIHQQQHQQQSVSTPGSSRGASPARSHNSPSASQTDLRYPARTSKLQAPQMRSRLSAPSPVRVPASGASGLPQPTDIPRPKSSGIPRPGSRLQAPRARSGLVAPRFQATPQEDWRDGCF
ncbi:SLAIN motif-containing protein 2-like isoform X2 [Eriocheir sinensis]|uniref:SLAIN motif-containing protein 2-like isoform X2 n=1 Tax=Eriocheir sinensis TaxID=95602 RepID=UPI0021C7A168|nr:SLAIN motif-containing protein 2-like isoform X2 [Eriocheir sinensis]